MCPPLYFLNGPHAASDSIGRTCGRELSENSTGRGRTYQPRVARESDSQRHDPDHPCAFPGSGAVWRGLAARSLGAMHGVSSTAHYIAVLLDLGSAKGSTLGISCPFVMSNDRQGKVPDSMQDLDIRLCDRLTRTQDVSPTMR